MTPSADQVAAFQANGGFAPSAVSAVVLAFVFAVLLLCIRRAKPSTQPRKTRTWCALKFKWTPVLAF
ncbi:DUF3262 family protein [Pseudomonas aeruginosa]|uniref:DUF3262 family protein n=1 Tax=Pseudomonas aeruginosa TaxID=287 RepID=UPI002AAC1DB3|nr:DUF3262 family protein [Pseudomonas aeruginosa]